MQKKHELYKTAQATISCAYFQAGDFVSVKFSCIGDGGVVWYHIEESQHGKLPCVVAYPEHHLTNFCL